MHAGTIRREGPLPIETALLSFTPFIGPLYAIASVIGSRFITSRRSNLSFLLILLGLAMNAFVATVLVMAIKTGDNITRIPGNPEDIMGALHYFLSSSFMILIYIISILTLVVCLGAAAARKRLYILKGILFGITGWATAFAFISFYDRLNSPGTMPAGSSGCTFVAFFVASLFFYVIGGIIILRFITKEPADGGEATAHQPPLEKGT